MCSGAKSRQFFAYPYGRHYIWGATAGMLGNLGGGLSIQN